MIKSIFKQLWNTKRSQTWVVVELVCVFCLTWYIVDYLFVYGYNKSIPNNRDIRHTWQVNLGIYPPEHPKYLAEADSAEILYANFMRVLDVLRNYSGVESVACSNENATPWSGSYSGNTLQPPGDTIRAVNGQWCMISPDTDFFGVFRYTDKGQPLSAENTDWSDPAAIVISRSAAEVLAPGSSAVGMEVENNYGNKKLYRVVGVVDDTKRFDYLRPQNTFYLPLRFDVEEFSRESLNGVMLSVRSRASVSDGVFAEAFGKEMGGALQIGNFYLKSVNSYERLRLKTMDMFGQGNEIRLRMYLMGFFLLNILLCVLGTFWYRVNKRRNEVGLRKALGSTEIGVGWVFILEGLCLMSVAAIPAMLIEMQFVVAGLIETLGKGRMETIYLPDRTVLRFLITNGITWIVMAVVIITSIWLPARNAAKMPPAEALHYE